jgi:DNA primase
MYKIPQDKIDEIRSAVNVVHYISQFLNLKKEGRNFKGLCPFHEEKTPSFVVSPEKQFYHCFGCGRGGNLFTFIMEYEKLNFVEAVTKAADFAGIALPKIQEKSEQEITYTQQLYDINEIVCTFFEKQLYKENNKRYLNYFLDRKLSQNTIKNFRLSYAPDSFDALLHHLKDKKVNLKQAEELGIIQKKQKSDDYYVKFRNRMMFPFFNLSGKIIGFGGRKMREEDQPKYLNSPESQVYYKSRTLYGLHQAIQSIREEDFIVLVEGYFDLLRLVDSGLKNVVASSGTALSEDQARIMGRYSKNIFIAYDGDEAGIRAAIRNARIIENQDMQAHIVPIPAGDDPDTFVLDKGLKSFRELLDRKVLPIEFQLDAFIKKNPDPSLEEKDAFIHQVLEELTSFHSTIKTGLYIHHLAERMQVSESMLVTEINRLRKRQRRYKSTTPKEEKKTTAADEIKVKRGVYRAEEGIIELLLNAGGEIVNYISEHVTLELFENEDYADLYGHIIHELEEHGTVNVHTLFDNPELNAQQHQLLTRLTIDPDEKDFKYAIDCIFQLKKWRLEKSARDLSQQIKAEANSPEAMMHYTIELNQLRKQIANMQKEHLDEVKAVNRENDLND